MMRVSWQLLKGMVHTHGVHMHKISSETTVPSNLNGFLKNLKKKIKLKQKRGLRFSNNSG